MSGPAPKPKLKKKDLIELVESRELPTVNPVTNKQYTVKQLKDELISYLLSELDPVDPNTAAKELLTSVNSVESEAESDDEASQHGKEDLEGSFYEEARVIAKPKQKENMTCKQENAPGQENIYSIVRNWDVSFDTTNDPVEFLERLDEYVTSCEIPKEKLLPVVTKFLKGKANLWHRNNRDDWSTWDEFVIDFKRYFYPSGYETNLLEKIIARKQRFCKKFVDYSTDLQTIMRRYGKFNTNEKLERIYENMNASYKLYVQRQDFNSVHELIDLCTEFEKINEQKYRNVQPSMFENPVYTNQPRDTFGNDRPGFRNIAGPSRQQNSFYSGRAEVKNNHPIGNREPRYLRNYNSKTSCFSCGGEYHRYTECTARKQIFCSVCGRIGVLSRNCCKAPNGKKSYEKTYTVGNMSDNENRVFIEVMICGKYYPALLDSGSTSSSVNQDVYDLCLKSSVPCRNLGDKFVLANNTQVSVTRSVLPTMNILGGRYCHQMYLLPDSSVVIIGMDLMRRISLQKIWQYIEETEEQIVSTDDEGAPDSNVGALHEVNQSAMSTSRETPPKDRAANVQALLSACIADRQQ
ncbi:hypothetical protein O0L34_g12859 [Tuta absoluta]|nr:hypothetical protein O0L34_g12859 [Tuta absoluta]